MKKSQLDRIVADNVDNLTPLGMGSVDGFVSEVARLFKARKTFDYFTRVRDRDPPSEYTLWNNRGKLRFKGVTKNPDVYIEYINIKKEEGSIIIDQHPKGGTTRFVFIPKAGLYLHKENEFHTQDRLLILTR